MDITVSSSKSEAFPMTIGESMACGVPCVVTDVGDCAWLVKDTGKIVPPNDHESLADNIKQLLSLSSSERTSLGEAARDRIRNEFSLESIAEQYHILYQSAMASRTALDND